MPDDIAPDGALFVVVTGSTKIPVLRTSPPARPSRETVSNAVCLVRPNQTSFASGSFLPGAKLQCVGKCFRRDTRHFQRTPQRAKGNFPVHGDNATAFAIWGDFFEDDMAAALAVNEESEFFQSLHRLCAGNDGQFSRALIQKCGSPLASGRLAGMIQGKGRWPLASWRVPPPRCDLGWPCRFRDTQPPVNRFLNQDK